MPCEHTNWRVVYLMGVFSLIQNTQYSIYLTSMFSYLKKLDTTATESQFGWIMATSSLGHCIGCFVLGWWNSRTNRSAPPMHCGFLLMLASNLVYLLVDTVPPSWVAHIMMLSRLLGGFGMGNSSPMRTCASLHSTSSDRSKAMASISGGRSVGTVVGPGLQLLFLPLGEVGFTIFPGILSLHSNNAPAFLGIVLTMVGFVSLIILFEEEVAEESDKKAIADLENQYHALKEEYPSSDVIAMLICMLTRFVQNFMQISIETLAPAILMMMYFQTRQEAVASMATTYLTTGFIATVLYILIIFTKLSTIVRDKIFNSLVLILFVCHLLATYSWQFYTSHVLDVDFSNETLTGCDETHFSWCSDLTISPQWVFYVGYILSFGLFMPFINVANATLYSKLLNPDSQGTQQSLYDISNTTARIFAPIFITLIYSAYGPRRAWEFLCILLLFTTFLWFIFDKRLVPLKPIQKRTFVNDGFEQDKSPREKLVS
ncbi:hypothetical protein CAEBREN_25339 [Caenorhabditis brenneri]|uniref:Major facilitator superfamily (MFS) profile domain-containing protein n=1 Tax=Caenorhabditis brenneri TaxID=135651 RepID=G0MS19_CAEBE|nr:hypothetical protein CAEBREN_25339 [Caenorhabditis brenneri]